MTRPRLPLLAVILAATDMALGMVYMLEPRARTLSPALACARQLAGVRLWVWGLAIALLGLAAVLNIAYGCHPTVAMSLGAGWHWFFTGSLIWSAWHDDHAALGGCVIFTSFTVLHLLAARQR